MPAQVDPNFLCADLHREKCLSVCLPSYCMTDAQVISAYLRSLCHVDSCVPTEDVTSPKRPSDCFFFKKRIREYWAHALADTGASENVISEELATFLELETHPRKQANVRLACDYSVRSCEMFARTYWFMVSAYGFCCPPQWCSSCSGHALVRPL